jgi:hypothetical protein
MYIINNGSKVVWDPYPKAGVQISDGQVFIDFGYLGTDRKPTVVILGPNDIDPILIPRDTLLKLLLKWEDYEYFQEDCHKK